MSNLYITNHAVDRFRERAGLPKRLVSKNAALALERGITYEDAAGKLRRYLERLYAGNQDANNIRVYCGMVYIFSYDILITLFPLPQEYRKTSALLQKKKKDAVGNIT